MASTVLRVKRRLEENPQDALVLMCKRMKTDTEEISPSLFVFRGTVNNEETSHVKNILPKVDLKLQSIPNVTDIMDKMRTQRKEATTQSRYEVVNWSRGLKENKNEETEDTFNLVDLKKRDDTEADLKYAYDLYTPWKPFFDIAWINDLVGVETELILGSYRDNGRQTPSDTADDDDDSNDENNWRNEYPDSEPSSVEEEDMIRAMKNVDIDADLSSDDGEDKLYDDPPFLSTDDVKLYGPAYAKYKAKMRSEEPDLFESSLIHNGINRSTEGYKDDSDDGFYYGEHEDTDQFVEQYQNDSDTPD